MRRRPAMLADSPDVLPIRSPGSQSPGTSFMLASQAQSPRTKTEPAPGTARKAASAMADPARNRLWSLLAWGIHTKPGIGAVDDPLECQADRVAERVMRMPEPVSGSPRRPLSALPAVMAQRQCAACCDEEDQALRRQANGNGDLTPASATPASAPPVVRAALGAAGQPLDLAAREFFEPRFGHDFGAVRVHTGAQADAAAHGIGARAFALGHNLAFATGEYEPHSQPGRALLAHELAHVVQQSQFDGQSADPLVRRACLTPAQCGKDEGSAVQANETFSKETVKQREQQRQRTPQQVLTGSHSKLASQADKLFLEKLPRLYPLVQGVFVDETLTPRPGASDQVGASIEGCKEWAAAHLPPNTPVPQFEGAKHRCVFVSKQVEQEAGIFNDTSAPTIGGRPRDDWRTDILGRFTHEATHERFLDKTLRGQFPEIRFPTASSGDESCSLTFANGAPVGLAREVSELAAEIGEFPLHLQVRDPKSTESLARWFRTKLTNQGESIPGTIRQIKCICACEDARGYIRGAFELASVDWSDEEKTVFHAQMKRGLGADYNVDWPFDLPPRVGTVGRHELSLDLGVGVGGGLSVGALTYRYVLSQWAAGRLRLNAGVRLNPGGLLASPPGELGAETLGLQYIAMPRSQEERFGGFTARIDTGLGIGEFSLKPQGTDGPAATGVRTDYVLRVGAGVQFFIPGLTSMRPVSLEAAYGLAQPLDPEAKRIHSFGLSLSFQLGG